MSVSNVTIIGNLGRDPETRYTPNGRMNVRFTVATNRVWTDQSGQRQEKTNWFTVTAWGQLAETLDKLAQQGYLAKGRQVYVYGRLDAREWQDNTGVTRTSLDVNPIEVQLVGGRAEGDSGQPGASGTFGGVSRPAQGSGTPGDFEDLPDSADIDDIPF